MASAEHAAWVASVLTQLQGYGPEAAFALQYMQQHRTKLGVHDQPTGARWTIDRRIEMHPSYAKGPADDPYTVSLVIHEVRHLQQGPLTALSVYGELEAWQLQFRFLKRVTGRYHADPSRAAILEKLVLLPLGWDRELLQHAREMIRAYAGRIYRIDLLPLYPLHREIAFRVARLEPPSIRTD